MTIFIHFNAHNHLYKTYKVENENKHNLLTIFGFYGQNRIHPRGYFSDPCTSTIFNLLCSPFMTAQLVEGVEVLVVVDNPRPGDFGAIGFLTRSQRRGYIQKV
jgi:hypothetical protein